MRILPLSTINDNRTILQEVLRVRKYLEENPCRNVFHIDANYDDNTIAYDITKVYIPLDFDGDIEGGDVIIFKNSYIAVLDTVSTDYVIIKADTAVSIKGDKGDTGATGQAGANGVSITGVTKTGTSGLVDTYTITFSNGTTSTFTVTNGADGADGANGADGNGIASIAKTGTSGLVDTYTITFTNGTTTTFTVSNGANGQGIPTGGTTGKVLQKVSDADYDTQWATVVGIPVGGTTGQILKKTGDANYAVGWENESGGSGAQKTLQFTDNLLINHNFLINQRGTATYSAAGYTVDRWYLTPSTGGSVSRRNTITDSCVLYLGKISQYNIFNSAVKGYILGVVEYDKSQANHGDAVINVVVGGTTLTPIEDGIIQNGNTYKYWALYQVDSAINTAFNFDIISDVAKETYLVNSAMYILNDAPTIDANTNINIFDDNENVELEKCKYYYEKLPSSIDYRKNCFFALNTTSIEASGLVFYNKKRIIPTLTNANTARFIFKQMNSGSVAIVPSLVNTYDSYAQYSANATTPSLMVVDETRTMGITYNSRLEVDAEIYP